VIAVEDLLARYLPDMTEYIGRHAGRHITGRESAADLAQSVCREVLEQLSGARFEYRGEAQFRGWLFQSAERKIHNRARHWRREKRSPDREVQLPSGSRLAGDALAHPAPSPSRQAMSREDRQRLEQAFARLAPRDQEIIGLAHEQQLPHREIARRLGIQEGNSRTLLARALARLARLAEEG
jgi:RNA polymerase sigma-70 factor (ECF subfamily)